MNRKPLQIPNPCDKKLEDMKKIGSNCHFCTHCSKKVYDLTDSSDEALWEAYERHNGQLCGKITTSTTPKRSYWTSWLFSLLTFLGLYSCENNCTTGEIEPHSIENDSTRLLGLIVPMENHGNDNK